MITARRKRDWLHGCSAAFITIMGVILIGLFIADTIGTFSAQKHDLYKKEQQLATLQQRINLATTKSESALASNHLLKTAMPLPQTLDGLNKRLASDIDRARPLLENLDILQDETMPSRAINPIEVENSTSIMTRQDHRFDIRGTSVDVLSALAKLSASVNKTSITDLKIMTVAENGQDQLIAQLSITAIGIIPLDELGGSNAP